MRIGLSVLESVYVWAGGVANAPKDEICLFYDALMVT
jgi:hypothetical protein